MALRKLSPVSYILALLCFLLPFVQISCGGQKLVSLTGVQLMTGTEIKPPNEIFGMKAESSDLKMTSKSKTDPNWFAAIAFVAGLAGVLFALVKMERGGLIGGIAGAVGAVSLLIMRVNISGELSKNPMGAAFTIDYEAGYYLALLLLIFGAVTLLMAEFKPGTLQSATAGGEAPLPTPSGQAVPAGVCSKCGAPLKDGSRFCGACGTWSRGAGAS